MRRTSLFLLSFTFSISFPHFPKLVIGRTQEGSKEASGNTEGYLHSETSFGDNTINI